jgi:RNA polymerase sigma-70 factor (ECF subfamily)
LRNRDDSKAWNRGWEEFYATYHPIIYWHLLRKGLSEPEAEEVLQEVIIGLANSLPQFQYDPARSSFKTWLFRVVRNKLTEYFRKRARLQRKAVEGVRVEIEAEALAEVADDRVLAPDEEWDLMWETNARRAALEHVRNRVKPMTMRLYLHHVVDGHSVEETVRAFKESNVSAEAVYLAKHRVQKMVDEAMERLRQGNVPM